MTRRGSCLTAVCLTFLGAVPSWADIKPLAPGQMYGGDVLRAAALLKEKKILSVGDALARVPKFAHGQLLQLVFREKNAEVPGDPPTYDVYVLLENDLIWEVILHAASGDVLLDHAEGVAGADPP